MSVDELLHTTPETAAFLVALALLIIVIAALAGEQTLKNFGRKRKNKSDDNHPASE